MTRDRRNEGGFTLVELLVVVAIIGIIAGALTESIIIGLRTTTATQAQVEGSIDRQRLATAFVPDMQSASTVKIDDPGCGPAPEAGVTRAPVVTLSRADRGIVKVAWYYRESSSGRPDKLVRRYCEGGSLVAERDLAQPVEQARAVADPLDPADPPCATATKGCTLKVTATDARGVASSYLVSATRRAA